nr:hypothetical protein [Tanacetum cinerariifolium]
TACATVFPNAFDGYCCRHLMMNYEIRNKNIRLSIGRLAKHTQPNILPDCLQFFKGLNWERETLQNWFTNRHEKYKDVAADELTKWVAAKVHRQKLKSAKKTTVRETYKELVYPLHGPSSWETPTNKQNVLLSMMEKQMPGRPSNNDRFRSREESEDKTPCVDFEEDDVIGGDQFLARLFMLVDFKEDDVIDGN